MPISNRFAVGSKNEGSEPRLNEVSIASQDRTYIANIPINIPPEEHLWRMRELKMKKGNKDLEEATRAAHS